MLPVIEAWVRNGGTLLVMPRSAHIGENLQPTDFYTRLCPLTWGERVDGAAIAGKTFTTGIAYKLQPQGGRQLYAYQDGSAAAVRYDVGQGRVAVFGFVPGDAFALEVISVELGLTASIIRSNDPEAAAWMLGTGEARYLVAINSENRAKRAEFTVELRGEVHAIDMLSGKPLPTTRDVNGRLMVELDLEPFWGRAVALLPRLPKQLTIDLPSRATAGQECLGQLRLLDAAGKPIAGNVPVRLVVRDARGQERPEYSGIRVVRDGMLELRLDLGRNDPAGRWTVEAREAWSGLTQRTLIQMHTSK
jgi:hypothetical protein